MFLLNLVRQGLAYKHGWWILQFLDKNSGSPWNNKERNWPSWAEWFDSQLIHAKHIESNDQLWSLVVSWESKVLGSPLFQGEFSILKKEIIARPILYAHPDFVSAAVSCVFTSVTSCLVATWPTFYSCAFNLDIKMWVLDIKLPWYTGIWGPIYPTRHNIYIWLTLHA